MTRWRLAWIVAPQLTPSAQGHRDGDGVRAEGDAGDPDAIEAHEVLECGGDAHGLRSPTRMQ